MIVDSSSQSYQSFCPCFRLLLLDHVLTPRMKARSQDAESITSSPVAIPRPREGLGGHCGVVCVVSVGSRSSHSDSIGNEMQGPKWIHVIHIAGSHQPKKSKKSLQLGTSAMVEPAFSHQLPSLCRSRDCRPCKIWVTWLNRVTVITLGWGSRCCPCHQRCQVINPRINKSWMDR